jgi:hypothetical protein
VILPDRTAEVMGDLRRLAASPSLEGAAQLLEEWEERQQMYNATQIAWTPSKE